MGKESPFRGDIVKGKVALITGGGSGIGFEISTQLGKHGARVAIMGRRKPVLFRRLRSRFSWNPCELVLFLFARLNFEFSTLLRVCGCCSLAELSDAVLDWILSESCAQFLFVFSLFGIEGLSFECLHLLTACAELVGHWGAVGMVNFSFMMSEGASKGDVRKQEDAKRVVEFTFRHFGRLDILINAAAGNFLVSPEDLSPNGFRTVMDIDSVGTFTMCHEALKYLKKGGPGRGSSGGGTILNISATLHYTAAWYQILVSAAKAAVDAVTRNLALEWGADYDVRVNGIAPGPIGDTSGMSKLGPSEIDSKARDYMPLYKLGETWDIAMAALYLASDAGKFVNGTTLIVDGGLWLSRPRHLPKEAVKQLSRAVEKRSRDAQTGVPKSKI
ncbi:hypothetical protein NL676_028502 [Syzygium grande]|nr:hypothetical protein NL676_028502 [Syzygium grande]